MGDTTDDDAPGKPSVFRRHLGKTLILAALVLIVAAAVIYNAVRSDSPGNAAATNPSGATSTTPPPTTAPGSASAGPGTTATEQAASHPPYLASPAFSSGVLAAIEKAGSYHVVHTPVDGQPGEGDVQVKDRKVQLDVTMKVGQPAEDVRFVSVTEGNFVRLPRSMNPPPSQPWTRLDRDETNSLASLRQVAELTNGAVLPTSYLLPLLENAGQLTAAEGEPAAMTYRFTVDLAKGVQSQLGQPSYWASQLRKAGATTLTAVVVLGPKDLPSSISVTGRFGDADKTMKTVFSDWGKQVTIQPPLAAETHAR